MARAGGARTFLDVVVSVCKMIENVIQSETAVDSLQFTNDTCKNIKHSSVPNAKGVVIVKCSVHKIL